VTWSLGSFLVTRCVCMQTPFERLLPLAEARGWDLEALVRETGCGGQCGMCRPYLAAMLRTGATRFTAPVPPLPDVLSPHD
jgi:bacterioferritin-associated ferredoxin